MKYNEKNSISRLSENEGVADAIFVHEYSWKQVELSDNIVYYGYKKK